MSYTLNTRETTTSTFHIFPKIYFRISFKGPILSGVEMNTNYGIRLLDSCIRHVVNNDDDDDNNNNNS
jgi:hypothetical protein